MKFHLARPDGRTLVTGHGDGYVDVNGERHTGSVVILPDRVSPWNVTSFACLDEQVFHTLSALPTEILLLGTGNTLQFPHPRLTQPLRDHGIGLEVMDTAAACRTYNVLLGEGRRIAAALLIEPLAAASDDS